MMNLFLLNRQIKTFARTVTKSKVNNKFFCSDINPFSNNVKSKPKFNKLSCNQNESLPTEKENLSNLLKEMKSLNVSSNTLVQKNDIAFIANLDEKLQNIKLGQFITLKSKQYAQCISIKENLLTFLLMSKEKLENCLEEIIIPNNTGKVELENLLGKVIDMSKIENFRSLLFNIPVTPSLTKTRKRRRGVDQAVLTGNILIDYVSPLYLGNFNVLTGGSNLGEKQVLNSLALNFINQNSENELSSNFVVYLTHSKREASKLSELFANQNNKNNIKNENFVIFNLTENPSDSEYYYLPRLALQFIKTLVEAKNANSKNKTNILYCYDDINTNILKEQSIFHTAQCYASSSNVFSEIREECGNFPSYSITAALIAEKNRLNYEFEENTAKTLNNIYSFTDKIVKFDANIKMIKKYIPNLYLDFSGLTNINISSRYITTHLMEFRDIMNSIMQSHLKFEESKKLNIQVDPWDNYLYYDSKFFFDFIFNVNLKSPKENLSGFENAEDKFIQLKFLLFVYYNNLLSHFKADGKLISWKLMEFISKISEDDKDKSLSGFVRKVLLHKYEPSEEEIDKFESKLEMLFDLFLQDLKTKNQFSDVKEDYFKF